MTPVSDDPALLHEDDLVGEHDGRPSVRDDDHGRRQFGALEPAKDLDLDGRIDRRGGVVEDEHPRPPHEGTCEGDPLTLAPRQGRPALADPRVVAVGEFGDESLDAGETHRPEHIGLRDV